jgi:acyl-CoA reductase-like NAD-dependent aldehyde dehydrogenase
MLNWLEKANPKTYGNFINGEWTPSKDGKVFSIFNSSNQQQLLASFQASTESDVDIAVNAANEAFKTWSKVPGPDRASILFKFADLLEKHSDELAFMLSAEQGKVLAESKGEVIRAAKETRFTAGEASRGAGQTLPGERPNVWNSTIRKPIGVIAAIAPWNFPVVTPVRKIVPALANGCTVVYKPASVTPWTSARLMELLSEAGVPSGVVNLVVGSGSQVGNALVNHPLVKGISFTGSTKMGLEINKQAAARLAKTQLELGGKNPAVVLDYEDVEYVAKQISSAAFACSGQRCTAISRVIVLKEKQEELIGALLTELQKIKVGPSWEESATMGPLVNQSQLDAVQAYIEIGKSEGATLLYGGEVLTDGDFGKGAYMSPAIFTDVTPNMRIAKEEIFGPVLSVLAVDNIEEAFELANDVEYGLAAAVFTKDLSTAYQFADQVESGMVHINHGTASAAHLPFGGTKKSGFGAFSIGSTNVDFFTEVKAVYFQY